MRNKNNKSSKKRNSEMRTGLVIAIACLMLLVVVLLVVAIQITLVPPEPSAPTDPSVPTEPTVPAVTGSDPIVWPVTEPPTDPPTDPPTEPPTDPPTAPPTQPPTTPPATENPTAPPVTAPPATEHVHDYYVSEYVQATCQKIGYTIYACACGDLYVGDETELGDHSYETRVIDPTTEAEGYTLYMCIHCDYEYRDDFTEKLPAPTLPPEEDVMFKLDHGLKILDIGSYSGPFLEDGSGESVEDILMIQVRNDSGRDVEFAAITLSADGITAEFSVSTLPAGATITLLEKNAMAYTDAEFTEAKADQVAFFAEPLSVHGDLLKLQGLDGALNVKNISGAPITGTIEIYYKNFIDGQLYGGVTYVARIAGGLGVDEVRQMMIGHYSVEQSIIMFIRIVE